MTYACERACRARQPAAMQESTNTSRLASLLSSRLRKRMSIGEGQSCPACGKGIVGGDHAVLFHGTPHHAACVLYRRRP